MSSMWGSRTWKVVGENAMGPRPQRHAFHFDVEFADAEALRPMTDGVAPPGVARTPGSVSVASNTLKPL